MYSMTDPEKTVNNGFFNGFFRASKSPDFAGV